MRCPSLRDGWGEGVPISSFPSPRQNHSLPPRPPGNDWKWRDLAGPQLDWRQSLGEAIWLSVECEVRYGRRREIAGRRQTRFSWCEWTRGRDIRRVKTTTSDEKLVPRCPPPGVIYIELEGAPNYRERKGANKLCGERWVGAPITKPIIYGPNPLTDIPDVSFLYHFGAARVMNAPIRSPRRAHVARKQTPCEGQTGAARRTPRDVPINDAGARSGKPTNRSATRALSGSSVWIPGGLVAYGCGTKDRDLHEFSGSCTITSGLEKFPNVLFIKRGGGGCTVRLLAQRGSSRIFASGIRAGRCRWPAGFLGDLPFPRTFHSGAAPYSPHFTLASPQNLMLRADQISALHSTSKSLLVVMVYHDSHTHMYTYIEPLTFFFNPQPGHSGFSHVGIVPDDAVGRRVFSGPPVSPRPFISMLLHTHFNHPDRLSRPRCLEPSKSLHFTLTFLKPGSYKGYSGTRYKSTIAATCMALNWRAVFSHYCVYLWGQRASSSGYYLSKQTTGQDGPAYEVPAAMMAIALSLRLNNSTGKYVPAGSSEGHTIAIYVATLLIFVCTRWSNIWKVELQQAFRKVGSNHEWGVHSSDTEESTFDIDRVSLEADLPNPASFVSSRSRFAAQVPQCQDLRHRYLLPVLELSLMNLGEWRMRAACSLDVVRLSSLPRRGPLSIHVALSQVFYALVAAGDKACPSTRSLMSRPGGCWRERE
ncbi:hypothetical protein PR048_015019 [Dryococelus australis]|uniref:Uncharacterized protein n=1 Tax=Dryococelus australis TaxID=614101 RepID=A0ABQ9HFX8_9NEOP|nr:hypothetical protein PR048_015019 [Dryococelus australis]